MLQIFVNEPNLDAFMSFQASNTITGKGVINTQGVVRFRDFGTTGVTSPLSAGPAGTRRHTAR